MKKILPLLVSVLAVFNTAISQNVFEFRYTAFNLVNHITLDSIKVINRSQNCDTLLHHPDTVLVLSYGMGINILKPEESLSIIRGVFPNPVRDECTIEIDNPEKGQLHVAIADITGKEIMRWNQPCERGLHTFRFIPGNQMLYFISAATGKGCGNAKILCTGKGNDQDVDFEYKGMRNEKALTKNVQGKSHFRFAQGDKILSVGYWQNKRSGIFDIPDHNSLYVFQFTAGTSCPGTPLVNYGGKVYNTIQIYSQCWLRENLDYGTMISSSTQQNNNSIVEKYCYNNLETNCQTYGGLYQWGEMMNYTTATRGQGICPPSWHVPSFEEWKVLFGANDSHFGIGDAEWYKLVVPDWHGYDVTLNLRSPGHWGNTNGKNLHGFSAMGSGAWLGNPQYVFDFLGEEAFLWSSDQVSDVDAYFGILHIDDNQVHYLNDWKHQGYSVRCIRDEIYK